MAEYSAAVNDPLTVKLWERRIASQVEKTTYMGRFIGTGMNSLIHLKTQTQKGPGDKVTCGLVDMLSGDGFTEGEDAEGNEEDLNTHDDSLFINELGHAARSEMRITPQRVPFNVRETIRDRLTRWYRKRLETACFNHLCGYTAESDLKYTGLNAVTAPTSNRALWAAASSGISNSSNDQTVQAQSTWTFNNVGYFEDLITLARTTDVQIEPIMVDGREKYVAFLHDYQIRDLRKAKSSSVVTWFDIAQANLQGGNAKRSHIYDGAIGEYNDIIIHRSNYITNGVHSSSGAAQTSTRRAVLCGRHALTMAFGKGYSFKRFDWVEETFDYRRKMGAAVSTIMGIKKPVFNSEDYGCITLTTYAA